VGGRGSHVWVKRTCSLRACGARPSAARPSGGKGAWLASPGMASKVVFSEGRTLCVRVARPHASRGIPFPPDDEARGRLPNGDMSRSSPSFPCGRAEPAPPRGGQAKARRPYGGKPGDGAKGGFLGGTHSVRPLSMAKRVPRDSVFTGWQGEAWSPTGICLGQARALFPGVRSPPLRGEAKRR
jgi:hypothetical protein